MKESKSSQTQPNPGEDLSASPLRGATEIERTTLHPFEALLRSHEELTSMLRAVGRRMIQDDQHEDELLHRMRRLLKRADRIRHAIKIQDENSESLKFDEELWIETAPPPESDEAPAADIPVRERSGTRHRLTRPHALRIVK